jgi:hypothetical protein
VPLERDLTELRSPWLILAPDHVSVATKLGRYFPQGLDDFWGKYPAAGIPESVAPHYQASVDAGIQYFVIQTLDPDDEESIALATSALAPLLQPRVST